MHPFKLLRHNRPKNSRWNNNQRNYGAWIIAVISCPCLMGWGFAAHRKIVDVAIQHVPEPLHEFFKHHRNWLVEHALDADLRKHSVIGEAEKHYIDLDEFGISEYDSMCLPPARWDEAIILYGEKCLRDRGIGPWNVAWQYQRLVEAFRSQNQRRILQCAADLAHYVADLHVPLHTSANYDGAASGQNGIHALWETQLPETYMDEYNLLGPDLPISWSPHCVDSIWDVIIESHRCLDLVFNAEKETMEEIGETNAFSYTIRGKARQKMRSEAFISCYHGKLNGQVEQRMTRSIQACSIYWYAAWVQAGQPQLQEQQTNKSRLDALIEWLKN